jgi:molybdate transport system substrate-binding protein
LLPNGAKGDKIRSDDFCRLQLGGFNVKKWNVCAAVVACGSMLTGTTGTLGAAELRLLAGGAMANVWAEIKPQFESVSGHKLEIFFGTTPNLIKESTSSKPFDVGVVPVEVMQDAAARANFVGRRPILLASVSVWPSAQGPRNPK